MRLGDYELLGMVGEGGAGTVYRARASSGAHVAVKILKRGSSAADARFARERRLLGELGEGAGFVPLLDAGEAAGSTFLVMPFVEGGTLRARLQRGKRSVEETLALGRALARALGEAHSRGIVHRDVKPENVLFERAGAGIVDSGRPLLADLGIAKHFTRDAPGASQSVSISVGGNFLGTAGYMAPEQLADAKSAGPPADVYALGAILYECLAGEPAILGDTAIDVLQKAVHEGARPLRSRCKDAPAFLVAAIERALAREPARRPADGHAFFRLLAAPSGARRGLGLPLAGLLGVALVAGAAFVLHPAAPPVVAPGRAPVAPVAPVAPLPPEKKRGGPAVRALVEEATAKYQALDFDGALALVERAIALDPGFAEAWRIRGVVHAQKGDLDGAIADDTKAIELDPDLAQAWGQRGFWREQKGDPKGAIADATRALELRPDMAQIWTVRGRAKSDAHDWDGALADLDHSLGLGPRNAEALCLRGQARVVKKDFAGAIADFDRAVELEPRDAMAYTFRGGARLFSGDLEGAVADEDEALRHDSAIPRAWALKARARLGLGQNQGAQDDANRALALDGTLADAWACRGVARAKLGDGPGAVEDLGRASELDPDNFQIHLDRAEACLRVQDTDGAIAEAGKALALDPRSARAFASRSTARAMTKDFKGALEDASRALELDPAKPENWLSRGLRRIDTGEPEGAIPDLERFLELAPDAKDAPNVRDRISRLRSGR